MIECLVEKVASGKTSKISRITLWEAYDRNLPHFFDLVERLLGLAILLLRFLSFLLSRPHLLLYVTQSTDMRVSNESRSYLRCHSLLDCLQIGGNLLDVGGQGGDTVLERFRHFFGPVLIVDDGYQL